MYENSEFQTTKYITTEAGRKLKSIHEYSCKLPPSRKHGLDCLGNFLISS